MAHTNLIDSIRHTKIKIVLFNLCHTHTIARAHARLRIHPTSVSFNCSSSSHFASLFLLRSIRFYIELDIGRNDNRPATRTENQQSSHAMRFVFFVSLLLISFHSIRNELRSLHLLVQLWRLYLAFLYIGIIVIIFSIFKWTQQIWTERTQQCCTFYHIEKNFAFHEC